MAGQERVGYTEEQQKQIIEAIVKSAKKRVRDRNKLVESIWSDIQEIDKILDNIKFDRGASSYWGRENIQLLYKGTVKQDNLTTLHRLVTRVLDSLRGGRSPLQLFFLKKIKNENGEDTGAEFFIGQVVDLAMSAGSKGLTVVNATQGQAQEGLKNLKQIQDTKNMLSNHYMEFRNLLLSHLKLNIDTETGKEETHGKGGYIAEAFGAHLLKHHKNFFTSITTRNFEIDQIDLQESIVFYYEIQKDRTPWWQGGDLPGYIQVKLDKKEIESIEQLVRVASTLRQIISGNELLNRDETSRGNDAVQLFNESFNISSQNQKDDMFSWKPHEIEKKYQEIIKNTSIFKDLK